MNVSDYLTMTPTELSKLPERELRKIVSQLASAANKRVKRLRAAPLGESSKAYQYAAEGGSRTSDGGFFSTKGKNLNQLRAEYSRLRHFMKMKTSTAGGWKKVRKEFTERMGGGFSSEAAEKRFWREYRKFEELHKDVVFSRGSNETQQDLRSTLYQGSKQARSRIDEINRQRSEAFGVPIPPSGYVLDESGTPVRVDLRKESDRLMILAAYENLKYERKFEAEDNGSATPL